MLDSRWVEENGEALDRALNHRGLEPRAGGLIEMLRKKRLLDRVLQDKRRRRRELPSLIGAAKESGDEATADLLLAEASSVKEEIRTREAEHKVLGEALQEVLARLPNVPMADVPVGTSEQDNVVRSTWGRIPHFDFKPRSHFELGEALGMMDFESAALISGARFVVLKGALARLERALACFMLDVHTREFGYTEIAPPLLVNSASMFGTAQLPKFASDQFQTSNDLWIIPTAEVSLTNLVRQRILEERELPLRFVASTPCFRLEAGAAGRDTRGMLRQHQFSKVELVSIVRPEDGTAEHERLLNCVQTILERLGLAHRTVVLCTGDMGFSSAKTYDIEVWMPYQGAYREISSCSLCGDFQARRMSARVRRTTDGKLCFAYTLNGSGLAIGRTIIALLENYQRADGSIALPECLHELMGCQSISA